MQGDAAKGLTLCGFTQTKPCLLVIGGSQGAQVLNHCVRQSLDKLCERFQVIHLCGKGKVDLALTHREGYCQLEYANEELADFFAASELVISRAGANALYEILALSKPHVLVPLPATMSRGDQLQNARYFEQKGISTVVYEEKLCPDVLMAAVYEVSAQREVIIHKIKELNIESATTRILSVIKELVRVVS
jgi:UDP-N-acetylglucosamine--N-acetylmuramyl-(pentapeptide) pyrophosphoryl-undecaprenol N-acetylglucosamine transferase